MANFYIKRTMVLNNHDIPDRVNLLARVFGHSQTHFIPHDWQEYVS